MYILAGKTAINKIINPNAAHDCVSGKRTPIPKRISKTPDIITIRWAFGIKGGTILTNILDFTKCMIPATIYREDIK